MTGSMIMGRQLKVESSRRCDFCNKAIPKGGVMYQVNQPDAKARGTFHGPRCYQAAVDVFEQLQKEEGILDEDLDLE